MATAVVYIRVSSDDQIKDVSLDVQETVTRDFCRRQGWEVVAVFREEGESAKTAARTELQRMLAYLQRHRGRVQHLVVYDFSRFARDAFDHLSLRRSLAAIGVTLKAATQPVPDGATGRAFEGWFAVANQWENEVRAEKIVGCMQETVRRGRWPWPAPLGYLNGRSPAGEKVVIPDPQRAPLVRAAFELMAAGETVSRALARVTALGLRSRYGHELRQQEFRGLLRNPFYLGRVRSLRWGIEAQGQHEPLVDEATWLRAQRRMSRSPELDSERRREHPDFPLRGFVRCEACGRPMTAAWSRGRSGRRYGYYFCWWGRCRAVRVAGPRLDAEFGKVLQRIQIPPRLVRLVEESLTEVWEARRQERAERRELAQRQLVLLQGRKERLLEAYLYEGVLDRATYERQLRRLGEQLAKLPR
jgi:DNA invertase Pin-like site-specific DNA recombinase